MMNRDIQKEFTEFLCKVVRVRKVEIPYYVKWVKMFEKRFPGDHRLNRGARLEQFEGSLRGSFSDWQVKQAVNAAKHYWHFIDRRNVALTKKQLSAQAVEDSPEFINMLDEVRRMLRLMHRSYKTERSYLGWIKRFASFVWQRQSHFRREFITEDELKRFLTYLAVEERIAAATQQQAFNALLFLFRHVLRTQVHGLGETVRAFKPKKGDKDRITLLPAAIHEDINLQLKGVRRLHEEDRRLKRPGVPLIEAGYDIRTVQELLGHSNVNTTMIYTHVAVKNKLGVISPLSKL